MKYIYLFFLFNSILCFSQTNYKTQSGINYKIGDTIQIGQPLSHLGWVSIYTENPDGTYIRNKNLINKRVIVDYIKGNDSIGVIGFTYFKKQFFIKVNDALKNKELIPDLERKLTSKLTSNKYENLKLIKELLDSGVFTPEEYKAEKKKILEGN